eukprot:m.85535 g.85535  ORF g.85535 m.85535 type:complete len:69 (+) comp12781_c0_seq3:2871-3077(+)
MKSGSHGGYHNPPINIDTKPIRQKLPTIQTQRRVKKLAPNIIQPKQTTNIVASFLVLCVQHTNTSFFR